ncbi:hypothetical protein [uncultured Aquimarina sp.]|uniref:hypothetical protein n=2 Tax=Aquimarina TaxID=290174 RepID=UPI002605EC23|nr:hypothetical protein [uncultured Aquimarina sp.]
MKQIFLLIALMTLISCEKDDYILLENGITEYEIDTLSQNAEVPTENLEEHFSSIKLTKTEIKNLVPFTGNSLRDISISIDISTQ